ncbi:MAG TPA: hypothetical protein DEP84_20705 [Chloroflexi bacterium]|nr:hypothetical protein [Chloroflexota bacterium]
MSGIQCDLYVRPLLRKQNYSESAPSVKLAVRRIGILRVPPQPADRQIRGLRWPDQALFVIPLAWI